MNHLRRGNWLQGYLAECGAIDGAAPSQAPDVAESAMYRQAVSRVEAALARLPARVRDTYLAHGLHGEKQVDIAERLGLSIDTVKRDIAQATCCIEDALHAWRHTQNAGRGGSAAIAGRTGRRRSLAALLGVFAVGVSGTAVWQHLQREALRYQTTLATLRGRLLQRSLPDGSEVTLDAQSRLEVDYTAARRLTRLREGAAFFRCSATRHGLSSCRRSASRSPCSARASASRSTAARVWSCRSSPAVCASMPMDGVPNWAPARACGSSAASAC